MTFPDPTDSDDQLAIQLASMRAHQSVLDGTDTFLPAVVAAGVAYAGAIRDLAAARRDALASRYTAIAVAYYEGGHSQAAIATAAGLTRRSVRAACRWYRRGADPGTLSPLPPDDPAPSPAPDSPDSPDSGGDF